MTLAGGHQTGSPTAYGWAVLFHLANAGTLAEK